MKRCWLVACLFLSACAPNVIYVTPGAAGDGVLLPEQIQRAADAYTATARVMATDAALAMATDQSARSTGTAVVAGTLGALTVEQTRSAIQLTQVAGQALATDAAAVRTESAHQTQVWATPTAAAVVAEVRATATAIARRDEVAIADQTRDATIADARGWLLLAVGILFLLGLAVTVVFGVSDNLSARAELTRAAADRARAQAYQMWIMQFGGVLLQLRDSTGWEIMQAPRLPAHFDSLDGSPSNPVREVPIREKQTIVSSVVLDEPETPERLRVLQLLDLAIRVAGAGSMLIPSATRLGMHPQDWQLAIDQLKAGPDRPAYVQTRLGRPKAGLGGGTQLCHPTYPTLGQLRDGMKRGDVLPRPEPDPVGPDPGNIQNAHFETS